jgi:hypothetical protein
MSKISFAALGLVAACLVLSAPSVSNAQHRHGHRGHRGHRGHDYHSHRDFGYRGYSRFDGYRGFDYGGYGYGYRRPAVVHPEYFHWTPYRGWHTHGHIHVPHRGHYHIYRY